MATYFRAQASPTLWLLVARLHRSRRVFVDKFEEWPAGDLRFRIGDVLVEIGVARSAFVLLLEPVYYESHFQFDFKHYTTLRIWNGPDTQLAALIHNALFYINSDYVRGLDTSVEVLHLTPMREVRYGPPGDPSKASRRRARTRRMLETAPIALFNIASSQSGDSRFLGFYRVLEYFFHRATVKEIERARVDTTIDTDALIELARAQRELDQLRHLLRSTLTAAERKAIESVLVRARLIKKATIEQVAEALYAHRNSLVHAKEKELARTRIPNPLAANDRKSVWNRFVEDLARSAIKRLA